MIITSNENKRIRHHFISWNFLFALFSTFIIVQSITIGDFNKLKPLGQSMNYRQIIKHFLPLVIEKYKIGHELEKKEKLKMNFFR